MTEGLCAELSQLKEVEVEKEVMKMLMAEEYEKTGLESLVFTEGEIFSIM